HDTLTITPHDSQVHTENKAEDNMETARGSVLRFVIEDDGGVVDVPFFILPAAPPDVSLPDRIMPTRGPAPQYVINIIKTWTETNVHEVGIMAVVVNGTDIAVGAVAIDPREIKSAIDRGETREIRVKIRGKIKPQPQMRTPSLSTCPEAVLVKLDEYQSDTIPIPLFRVRNLAGVKGTFSIGLASKYEKRFNFGFAIQEDIKDLINVNFGIVAYAYSLGGSYSGSQSMTIPSSSDVVRVIHAWGKGKFEFYRVDYLTGGGRGCVVIDSDWLYRIYPNYIHTVGNEIVMGVMDLSIYDAAIPGTVSTLYKMYTGTGSPEPYYKYKITTMELAGWFYQECPGSVLSAVDMGAGIELGKILVKLGKIASRYAKILEMIGISVAWAGETKMFVVLGDVTFDADSGKNFGAYFYTTQHKVNIPSCGNVDLPFIYAEFR
ncbi:MAG: hypothetical protein ACK4M3_02665, partial [Pyrobaculum sp.]